MNDNIDMLLKIDDIKDIQEEVTKLFKAEKVDWKKVKELKKLMYDKIAYIEDSKGLLYNNDIWITQITSDPCDTMNEARDNLLEKLLKLNGVKLVDNGSSSKNKLKIIEVLTRNKIYKYEIHAHCSQVKVGTKPLQSIFGGTTEVNVYEPKFVACCGKNIFNAFRDEYYWE